MPASLRSLLLPVLLSSLVASPGGGGPARAEPQVRGSTLTIRNDAGGRIIEYALRVRKAERDGHRIRFAGRCDSACTLFLNLPESQLCVVEGASFGFHLPYGSTSSGNRLAADFLLRSYPDWVKAWLDASGGLTGRIKTMDFEHVSQHVPLCDERSASL